LKSLRRSSKQEETMKQQVRKHQFNLDAAAMVVWMMFAAVVCYAASVWLAVALIEHDHAFAVFSGDVYLFAAALSAVIACTIGITVSMIPRDAGRRSRFRVAVGAARAVICRTNLGSEAPTSNQ
jgi:hypothetical protein